MKNVVKATHFELWPGSDEAVKHGGTKGALEWRAMAVAGCRLAHTMATCYRLISCVSLVCGPSTMSAGRPVPLFFSHTSYYPSPGPDRDRTVGAAFPPPPLSFFFANTEKNGGGVVVYVQVPAGVMRLTTVNGQNRAAFVDNKRNMRKCNCHASVTLIGSILSLVIILRITTKSQSSKKQKFGPLTCTQTF